MTALRSSSLAMPLAMALWLAGCGAAPEVRLHSLLPAQADAALPTAAAAPALRVSVAPVTVPAAVDQPQWLVRRPDDTLQTLEQDRWASPLQEEMRAALREGLAQRWAAVDAGRLPPTGADGAAPASAWRVVVDVRRLDLRPGRDALLDAHWSVLPPQRGASAVECAFRVREPVTADGSLPLAEAQRRAVARLADEIGRQLRGMADGGPARCIGPAVS